LKKKGLTKQLLWKNITNTTRPFYSYSQFCARYGGLSEEQKAPCAKPIVPVKSVYRLLPTTLPVVWCIKR